MHSWHHPARRGRKEAFQGFLIWDLYEYERIWTTSPPQPPLFFSIARVKRGDSSGLPRSPRLLWSCLRIRASPGRGAPADRSKHTPVMGAKQMKCLSSASPVRSPKEEYAVTCTSDTPGQETIRHQPEEQQAGLGHDKSELTDKKQLTEEVSFCGLCPSLGHDMPEEEKSWEEQLDIHQEQLEKEMHEARRMVLRLQALLLNGSLPEDDPSGSVSFGDNRANGEQQLVLTRSCLDQSVDEALDLKRELLRHKQEVRHIQAIKDALQQRLSLQEDAVLQLKQELLRSNMAKDQLEGENVVLKNKLSERNTLLGEYEQQLGRKDRMLQQQKHDEAQHKAQDVSHNRHVARNCSRHLMSQGEELQLVREALRSLRDNFSGHDPQHHTLDTLEQGVSSLMDRLHSEAQRRQNRGEFKSPGRRANSSDRDSWPPSSKMAHSHSSPGLDGIVSTKVLYYTDRSLTPFLINLPKRLGEVTLRDFKAAVDRQGSFRYHFKALDPEFGTVKEEVFQDGAVVPGWEGKIVAWVEEDHGERR
ncbi:dixin-A isoform X3 [Hippocampus comes]|uniref:dixin-A isoform X3 n=1 Tax=Hippocampus comes TaxID=109280 RepID=UPI00094EDE7F|nr:PREDICTED: dixin-A-like isoform X3 [Hippocampus comes]